MTVVSSEALRGSALLSRVLWILLGAVVGYVVGALAVGFSITLLNVLDIEVALPLFESVRNPKSVVIAFGALAGCVLGGVVGLRRSSRRPITGGASGESP